MATPLLVKCTLLGVLQQLLENLVVVPTIQCKYSNGSAVEGGSTSTLSAMVTSGNSTTRILPFSPLQTSHGGEYTCRAIMNTGNSFHLLA